MQERDMNLCVLAKKCGISYSTIQTTARRGGQLSVETIERICLGLGITLKDFFDSSYL
ncbi:helix-turn-helix domain-containing protein [Faecalibacterium prausnitzii]|nr:helix-turn-helix transcriptional regulator [Faecalibacterium prausnitzii]